MQNNEPTLDPRIKQWTEDYVFEKIAGTLPPSFEEAYDIRPRVFGVPMNFIDGGTGVRKFDREPTLPEYLARRMKENSTNLSISDK